MGFDASRVRVLGAALVFASAAAIAAAHRDSPRVLVLCTAVALCAAALGGRALWRLAPAPPQRTPDPPFGAPHEAVWLKLASRLEHAPVALWQQRRGDLQALNAAARRLAAPGRAVSSEALVATLRGAQAGRRTLVSFDTERGQERALLAATPLIVEGQEEVLLALMPIESELEAQTLAAWQQLVHVLTHEIMNSLTPIASLSRTAQEMLAEQAGPPDADLNTALDAIARRATDLAEFVASYRSVSQLPPPRFEVVALEAVFNRLASLVGPGWQTRGGHASFEVRPASLELRADPGQLEQALLNLIQNAADATAGTSQPQVQVSARLVRGSRLAIEVSDNGPGVAAGLEASIFTPFFSTRKEGLGVGLALVRNLVHGMGGTVRYSRRVRGGACFVLAF